MSAVYPKVPRSPADPTRVRSGNHRLGEASIASQALAFYETLVATLPVRSVSDRTCFRRVSHWLRDRVEQGHLPPHVFQELLLYAREACLPGVRNPNAVFMSVLRKEFGYGKDK